MTRYTSYLILLAVVLYSAGCKQRPTAKRGGEGNTSRPNLPDVGEPSVVHVGETSSDGLMVRLRLLRRYIAAQDSVSLALHFDTPDGSIREDTTVAGAEVPGLMPNAALKSISVSIRDPDGQVFELQGSVSDETIYPRPEALHRNATYRLTVNNRELKTARGHLAEWTGDAVDLSRLGVYEIQVHGKLGIGDVSRDGLETSLADVVELEYKVGPIPFAVVANVANEKRLRRAGSKSIAAKTFRLFPGRAPDGLAGGNLGATFVHEDKHGRIIVYEAGRTSRNTPWSYPLYRAVLDPLGNSLRVQQRQIDNCIAAGTFVDGETGLIAVERLTKGDRVWGYDLECKRKTLTTVRGLRRSQANQTLVINGTLRTTADHPIYTADGWTPASHLGAHAVGLSSHGETTPLSFQRPSDQKVDIFDITVGPPHNFFAGGILVHNKDRAWSAPLDDHWEFYFPAKAHKWK